MKNTLEILNTRSTFNIEGKIIKYDGSTHVVICQDDKKLLLHPIPYGEPFWVDYELIKYI